jgi:hypothetical protein
MDDQRKEEGGQKRFPLPVALQIGTVGKKPRSLAIVAVLKNAEKIELGHRGSATEAAGDEIKQLRILKDIAVAE